MYLLEDNGMADKKSYEEGALVWVRIPGIVMSKGPTIKRRKKQSLSAP